jgi:tetratricopeptide (TPR) repeat protein
VISPPPPGVAPGTRVRAPVSGADLAPYLLERVGLGRALLPQARTAALPASDPPAGAEGEGAGDERAIHLETMTPFHSHRWHPLRALVWRGFKYVEAPRPELFELSSDPRETNDLHAARADVAQRMAARLRALEQEHPPLSWHLKGALTSEDQNRLSQLGYLASTLEGDPFDPALPDPKDRMRDLFVIDEISKLVFEVSRLLGLGQALRTGTRPQIAPEQQARAQALLEQARQKLEALRAANPRDPFLDQIEATIALDAGSHADAVKPLERAVVNSPRSAALRYNLAVAYRMTGHPDWARREMEKAVVFEPRFLAAHRWLLQFSVTQRDWAAAAHWVDALACCPGQEQGDLDNLVKARARIEQELSAAGGAPRPPEPVTDADLAPEGCR